MTKQSIFPYYAEALCAVKGAEILNIEGAAMMHFSDVANAEAQALKYPCRIDALIMVLCVRGEVSFSSHMSDYTLKANQFFISSASVFQFHSLADSEFYMLAFSSEFLTNMNVDVRFVARMVSQLRSNAYIARLGDEDMRSVSRFFESLHEQHSTEDLSEYKELSLRHVYCAMIYRIADAVMGKDSAMAPVGVKERSSEYFEKLMSLLSEHYREQRNVEFYADKLNISSKHLTRVIRSFTGKSVHQWIDEFVALEIKNLLKYSNMSIQQISYHLNFPNPSFMGQYFKRITGMTPGDYKKS